jgi:hypothetical protein
MSGQGWLWHRAGLPWRDLGGGAPRTYVRAMTEIQIKVILDAAHIGQTDQMCKTLAAMGLSVESSFPEIGVIFGAGDPALLPRMRAMAGVTEAVAEGVMRAVKGG